MTTRAVYPIPCVSCGEPAPEGHHIDPPTWRGRRRIQSDRRVPICTPCHKAIHRGGDYKRGPNGEDLEAIWQEGARI